MQIRFNLDPDTGLPHVAQHGVTEQDVRDVLSSKNVQDRPGKRSSRVAIGQTRAGRFLKVIYAPAWDEQGIFIITAYDPSPAEVKAFRRRQRRRS